MTPRPAAVPPRLQPLSLQELRLQPEGRHWAVDQLLTELESLTPVRGEITARHHGSVLELKGRAETIVTLCCDRCLQHFNHPLAMEVSELLELRAAGRAAASPSNPLEGADGRDLAALAAGPALRIESLDDRLDPGGDFDPERWLFEQLSLQLPVVNRCGSDCPGPPLPQQALKGLSLPDDALAGTAALDPRWAALRQLRP